MRVRRAAATAAVLALALAGVPAGGAEEPPEPTGAQEPALPKSIDTAIADGVTFLVASQNRDGSWGSARQTKALNIYAPVPGAHRAFRAAVTSMCVSALIETGATERGEEASLALERGELWLLEHLPAVRRATADAIYNVWAHAYGIQALVRMHHRHCGGDGDETFLRRIREVVAGQIDLLGRYESVDGGWGYYDFEVGSRQPASSAISFTTSTVLDAFHDARSIGVEAPERLVERAIDSVQRQRKGDGSFLYGEYLRKSPLHPVNRPGGSLGRTMACYLALRLWGDETVTDEDIAAWMDKLFERNGWLDIGRKRPVPHESWFQVAGYFFYYGHYYAARCLGLLAPEEAAPRAGQLADLLIGLQESDGSWFDFPFYAYHKPYGTAFALMALQQCRQPSRSQAAASRAK